MKKLVGFIYKNKWRITCPICERQDNSPDKDFPKTMQNCNNCGSEWNKEVTFNAWEDFNVKELEEHKKKWDIK